MTVMILVGAFYIGKYSASMVEAGKMISVEEPLELRVTEKAEAAILEGRVIVIDCGHGGFDSGKVGINGALEKEINLAIGEKLQALLCKAGAEVVMTRDSDGGLYDENEENKKQQDMKRRVEKINGSGADIAVSIHQNSYTEEYVKGPQMFYYETSIKAKTLAEVLQQALNEGLNVERPREIKPNESYYVLRKTEIPTVIVECGFLSNSEEAAKLVTEEYQQQVALAVLDGICKYFEEETGEV